MRMRPLLLSATLLLGSALGCGLNSGSSPAGNAPANLTGNWQIQTTNSATVSSNVLLIGALVSSGTRVTGTFRYTTLTSSGFCGTLNQVVTVSGTLDDSQPLSQSLTLTSPAVNGAVLSLQLNLLTAAPANASGTLQVTGGSCPFASTQALALEYPAITGTYAGSVQASSAGSTGGPSTGTVTLTSVQSTTPAADGTFPVSATLAFASGACNTSIAVTGTVSGPILSLSSTTNPITATGFVTLGAVNIPSNPVQAPSLQASNILYFPSPCSPSLNSSSTYSGTLAKQ